MTDGVSFCRHCAKVLWVVMCLILLEIRFNTCMQHNCNTSPISHLWEKMKLWWNVIYSPSGRTSWIGNCNIINLMDIALQDSRNLLLLCSGKELAFVKLCPDFCWHHGNLTSFNYSGPTVEKPPNSQEPISQWAQEKNNHKCLNNKVTAIIVGSSEKMPCSEKLFTFGMFS